jgi:hypothetical protein
MLLMFYLHFYDENKKNIARVCVFLDRSLNSLTGNKPETVYLLVTMVTGDRSDLQVPSSEI